QKPQRRVGILTEENLPRRGKIIRISRETGQKIFQRHIKDPHNKIRDEKAERPALYIPEIFSGLCKSQNLYGHETGQHKKKRHVKAVDQLEEYGDRRVRHPCLLHGMPEHNKQNAHALCDRDLIIIFPVWLYYILHRHLDRKSVV